MKKLFRLRYLPFYLVGIYFALKLLGIAQEIKTSDIQVSQNNQTLTCAASVKIHAFDSIRAYWEENPYDTDIQSQLCTFDKIFDGSDYDRIQLFWLSEHILENGFYARHDIAQHFYRKIIAANPDDALSLYLKKYKIENPYRL